MCNCVNYCPHCGQPKQQPYYGYWRYNTYPYPTWIPTGQGGQGGGIVGQTITTTGYAQS